MNYICDCPEGRILPLTMVCNICAKKQCKVCGKKIMKYRIYCSKKCLKKQLTLSALRDQK